jgi:glucans biosynthesis protein
MVMGLINESIFMTTSMYLMREFNCSFRFCVCAYFLVVAIYSLPRLTYAETKTESIGYGLVQNLAKELAGNPFQPISRDLPAFLAELNYDQYRNLRFHPNKSLWRDNRLTFEVQFFPRGWNFRDHILVNQIHGNILESVQFDPDMFDFARLSVSQEIPTDLGFAGFRLHYPINRSDYLDEVIAFLGASYFRGVGRNEVYGLSARGLALNIGEDEAEEFPIFREFWLVRPAINAKQITLYALLDSPSVAGAYQFTVKPGFATEIDVTANLFFRNKVKKLGLAPLTSMFFHGESTSHLIEDFRPEVHDSDGLLIVNSDGERIWRPLINPQHVNVSEFTVKDLRGFGLLQRDRDFNNYQDLEAKYHLRPSAWIEPIGEWGPGKIELVEIPTSLETNDNIVVFWLPDLHIESGTTHQFKYKLSFTDDPELDLRGGRTEATRIQSMSDAEHGQLKFVLEFVGTDLTKLKTDTGLLAEISSTSGKILPPMVQKNPYTNGYRVSFDFVPDDKNVIDLRCSLQSGKDYLTETWVYPWRNENY